MPDGRTLGVCCWGDPEGDPILLLHGTPGSRFLREPGNAYSRHRLRVITYDRPGYGLSTRLPGRQVADSATDIRTIADALELEHFGVAGVSSGGPSALAAAAVLTDRVVRCATVVGLAPFAADGLEFFAGMVEDDVRDFELALRGAAALEPDWDEFLAWVDAGMPELDIPDDGRAMLVETMREARRQGPAGFVDDMLSLVDDWGFTLDAVQVPTRVMSARDDTSVPPSHGEWLVSQLPAAELIMVDGGHLGPRQEEELRLLAWLARG